jgi:hypothetical protein
VTVINSVGVMSFARLMGALYGCLGLIFAPLLLFIGTLESLAGHGKTPFAGLGIGFAIIAPFLYGALGFIFGVIGAALYNLVASWVGGIELELAAPERSDVPAAGHPQQV